MLTIQHRAGEDGKLYGSVTTKEIAEAIAEARGLRVDRKKIRLDDPIRELGTYMVEIERRRRSHGAHQDDRRRREVARPNSPSVNRGNRVATGGGRRL